MTTHNTTSTAKYATLLSVFLLATGMAAAAVGSTSLDSSFYTGGDTINVTVRDGDLNTSASRAETAIVDIDTPTETSGSVTAEDVADGTNSVTTDHPVSTGADNNITSADFTYNNGSTSSGGISSVSRNTNGTVTLTLSSSSDSEDTIDYTRGETVKVTETDQSDTTFNGTIGVSETDSDGTLHASNGDQITTTYDDVSASTDRNATANFDSDGANPDMSSVKTEDSNDDGTVDELVVTFTESVESSSLAASDFNASTNGGTALTISGITDLGTDDNQVTIDLDTNDGNLTSGDTSIKPQATLLSGQVKDLAGKTGPGSDTTLTSSDSAAPSILSATTFDDSNNGDIDRISVTMSEAIDDSAAGNITDTSDDEFSVSTGTVDNVRTGSSSTDDSTIQLDVSGFTGTDPTPTVTQEGATSAIEDLNANSNTDTPSVTASDGAAPQITDFKYEDSGTDGKIDQFTISFSESVTSSSNLGSNDLNITNVGDFTGIDYSGTNDDSISSSGSSKVFTLDNSASVEDTADNSGNLNIKIESGNSFSLTDGSNSYSGTGASATDQATYTDGAAPQITDVEVTAPTKVQASFSEQVDGAPGGSGDLVAGDFQYSGSQSVSSVSETGLTSTATLTLDNEVDNSDLGTDTVDVASSSVYDSADNKAPAGQDVTVNDDTPDDVAPSIMSASTMDTDNNGQIDHYKVDFDEAVDDSTASISSQWSVSGYSNPALDSGVSGDTDNDDVIYISFDESGSADTDATPDLTVSGATLEDASSNGNVLPDVGSGQVSETDGAAPSIVSASTKDTSNDGNVDKITVTMSEAIDDSKAGNITDSSDDEFSVSAGSVDTVQTGSSSTDDSTVELLVSGFTGTSVTPTVTQKGGAISDGSNTNSDAPSVTASDTAAPVVTEFEAQVGSRRATVKFSEPVTDQSSSPEALASGDFTYSDSSSGNVGSISEVSHDKSAEMATVILDKQATSSDVGSDKVNFDSGKVEDQASTPNSADTATATMADSRDALALSEGWNVVSPAKVQKSSFGDSFTAQTVAAYDDGQWMSYETASSDGEMNAMYIKVSSPKELALANSNDPQNYPVSEDLEKGWNLVGVSSDPASNPSRTITNYLTGLSTSSGDTGVSKVDNPSGDGLGSGTGFNEVAGSFTKDMKTFQGYWVFMENQDLFGGFYTP